MKTNNKILSISIAAYNVEKYLDETLASLLCEAEMIEKLDVIIVDDGSADCSAQIAQKYVDLYPGSFRLVRKQNGGHGSTLNTSVPLAEGKYFKMLDGDDWFDGTQLEELVNTLEQSEEDVILSPYQRVYQESHGSELVNRHHMDAGRSYKSPEVFEGVLEEIYAAELTVRTEILQNKTFHITEKCAFTDDEYVFTTILYATTYKKILNTVYQYRIGVEGQTISDQGRRAHWLDAGWVAVSMLHRLSEEKMSTEVSQKVPFLYRFIHRTADFQCRNFIYAENMKICEEEFFRFSNTMETIDREFEKYLTDTSENYDWWKWIFSVCHQNKKDKFILFGAGRYGERIYRCLHDNHIEICGIVDNNEIQWGKEKWGMPISAPQLLKRQWTDGKVIVAVKNQSQEIVNQLRELGISEDRIISFGK